MSQYKAGDKAIVLPTYAFSRGIVFQIGTIEEITPNMKIHRVSFLNGDQIGCNARHLQPLPIPHNHPEWMLEAE